MPTTSQPQPNTNGEMANPEAENANNNNAIANNSVASNNQSQANPKATTAETSQPNYEVPANAQISGKVGKNGKNQTDDISLVQKLLHRGGLKNITVSGQLDAATEEAITSFKMVYGLVMDFAAIHPEEFNILKTLSPNSLGAYKRKGVFAKVIDTPDAAPKMAALYDFITKNNSEKEANAEPQQETEDKAGEPVDLAASPSSYKGQNWNNGKTDKEEVEDFARKAAKLTLKHPTFQQFGFESGKDLLDKMETACAGGKEIRYMAFFGHAASSGMAAKDDAGFYARGNNIDYPIATALDKLNGASDTTDLANAIKDKKIKFHKDGIILFLNACNSFHDFVQINKETGQIETNSDSVAKEIAIATQTPVIAAIGKTGSNVVAADNDEYAITQPKSKDDPQGQKTALASYYLIIPTGNKVEIINIGDVLSLDIAKKELAKYREAKKRNFKIIIEAFIFPPSFAFNSIMSSMGVNSIDELIENITNSSKARQIWEDAMRKLGLNEAIDKAADLLNFFSPTK